MLLPELRQWRHLQIGALSLLISVGINDPSAQAWPGHKAAVGSATSPSPLPAAATGTPSSPANPLAPSADTSQPIPAPGIVTYNKGVELFQIAQIQAEKGNLNGQKALLKEALKHFSEALTQNPKLVEAQSNRGFVYLTLRQYGHAVREFKKALDIDPRHLYSLNGLMATYTLMNQYDKALPVSDTLVKLAPEEGQYWFNRGSLLQKAGRPEEADKSYHKALLANPQDQRAMFNLGTLAEAAGDSNQAKQWYMQTKDAGIDTPIGLEALHRLEGLPTSSP